MNPQTGNGGHIWCLSSSPSLSVGFSNQDETMGVVWSASHGAHYHATLFICSLDWGLTREHGVKACTNSVPKQHSLYPGGRHTLVFYTKFATPAAILTPETAAQLVFVFGRMDVARSTLHWTHYFADDIFLIP